MRVSITHKNLHLGDFPSIQDHLAVVLSTELITLFVAYLRFTGGFRNFPPASQGPSLNREWLQRCYVPCSGGGIVQLWETRQGHLLG